MCDISSDPSMHDPSSDYGTPRECRRLVWARGQERICGSVSGLRTWTDTAGVVHAACRFHVAEVLFRHPEAIDPTGYHETHGDDGPSGTDCPICQMAFA